MNKTIMSTALMMAMMFQGSEFSDKKSKPVDKELLLKEYDLIKQKKSNLSSMERSKIVRYVEREGLNG